VEWPIMKMHPKLQQILESKKKPPVKPTDSPEEAKKEEPVEDDLFSINKKKEDAPPPVEEKKPKKKAPKKPTMVGQAQDPVKEKAHADTMPAPATEKPVEAALEPDGEIPQPESTEAPQGGPAEIADSLAAVFTVNKTVLESLKKVHEYFSFTGAQMVSVADDRFKYLEGEMKKFDARIAKIESVLKGIAAQQATPPDPMNPDLS